MGWKGQNREAERLMVRDGGRRLERAREGQRASPPVPGEAWGQQLG